MKLKREITSKINFVLDQLLPPILRDSKLFMFPIFKLALKDGMDTFLSFKEKALSLTKEEYSEIY